MSAPTAKNPAGPSSGELSISNRPLEVLGWAFYLACSWTWCIGMFLPVLLLRDQGTWGWVVFAVPNVVGAAAMGWVLQRAGSSDRMVGKHTSAMVAFSVVTILFHVLFAFWIIRWLSAASLGSWGGVAAMIGVAIVFYPLLVGRKRALVLSLLTWAASLTAFIVTIAHTDRLHAAAGSSTGELAFLAPVCLIGFAFCPYLDLTFHRARQAVTTYGSVAAFTLGFGVFFLTMIVFTLWYAPTTIPPDAARGGVAASVVPTTIALAMSLHMIGQAAFTVSAHGVEVVRRLNRLQKRSKQGLLAGGLFGLGILGMAWVVNANGPLPASAGLSGNELGYRLFMSFYGLIAPAYVWLFVVPWKYRRPGSNPPSDKARWIALAAVLAMAGPAYWAGFIALHMEWLLLGVLVIAASRPLLEWQAGRVVAR